MKIFKSITGGFRLDKAAFERLYPDMLPGFCRLAQSLLRQPMDAQDAMQQAAVKAWQAPDKLPPRGFG